MKHVFLIILALFSLSNLKVNAHSGKPKYHVIIDTDGALDDMRAISMLLSANDIRVLALTCSQGSLLPEDVYKKVYALLSTFHHEGIPVGISPKIKFDLPAWEAFARHIKWGNINNTYNPEKAEYSLDMLKKTLKNYKNKVTLIALGSLKTYADWIRANPEIKEKIDRIIWYNSHSITDGFNYKVSPESFDFIKGTGIKLDIVSNSSDNFPVNNKYLQQIDSANSIYADQILKVHQQNSIQEKIKVKHLHMWDDLIPLYLTTPLLFDEKTTDHISYISVSKNMPANYIYEITGKLLESSSVTNNRVFVSFPVNKNLYKTEYADILEETIKKYGLIEWKAICMTNEIHGHTGIYSIIGAKAGIRALEYFNVGVNNLEAVSYVGLIPPFSCFNDGLQISTGSTIGQGLITISDSIAKTPSAMFEFNDQKVIISLKQDIADQMKADIRKGVEQYGALTDKYWLYIEELAVRYWTNYDRHYIFDIRKL